MNKLQLNGTGISVDLTHGFCPDVAEQALSVIFERLAYFQIIREIEHHNVRSKRKPKKDEKLNKIIEWTNASQNRQLFTRVMGLLKMENKWKSVSEVASLCKITTKATRIMIEDADKLGTLERCPDTHKVRANDYAMGVWYEYVKALYDKDEQFMLSFFTNMFKYYEGKKICKLADYEEVTSCLLSKIR